jgi:hypothetical protein
MRPTNALFALTVLSLNALVLADPVAQNVPAQQTIVPFTTLPACAKQCGTLYDVQGACSPPQVQAANTKTCFCADARLTPFKTGTTGVCDQAACPAADLTTIQSFYNNLCGSDTGTGTGTGTGTDTTTTSTSSTSSAASTGTGGTSSGSNGDTGSSGGSWFVPTFLHCHSKTNLIFKTGCQRITNG